jgi:endonuclease-3 related protein
MTTAKKFMQVFDRLYAAYGPQQWWPGDTPFEIMVGAVLTQNTSWTNVERGIENLKTNRALHPQTIIDTHHKRLASWLKPVGYFNVKAKRLKNYCSWYLAEGELKQLSRLETELLRENLLSVNGVGPETADDILLYAFERPVFVIDAYTRRLFARLGYVAGDEDYETLRQIFEKELNRQTEKVPLFNEYHALIVNHAKYFCKTKPACAACCLKSICHYT